MLWMASQRWANRQWAGQTVRIQSTDMLASDTTGIDCQPFGSVPKYTTVNQVQKLRLH
jgi:hypothetical protein